MIKNGDSGVASARSYPSPLRRTAFYPCGPPLFPARYPGWQERYSAVLLWPLSVPPAPFSVDVYFYWEIYKARKQGRLTKARMLPYIIIVWGGGNIPRSIVLPEHALAHPLRPGCAAHGRTGLSGRAVLPGTGRNGAVTFTQRVVHAAT